MTTPTDATDRATPPSPAGDMILLLADLQQDFVDLPLTVPFARLRRNVAALMELATIFDMPRVVTAVPMAEGKAMTSQTRTPGRNASARISSFSASDHRRRPDIRPTNSIRPVIRVLV